MYEYLLRIDGEIIDTIQSLKDLKLAPGRGVVIKKDYHVVTDVDFYFDFDKTKKVYIIDIEYVPFESVPPTVRTKMIWDSMGEERSKWNE